MDRARVVRPRSGVSVVGNGFAYSTFTLLMLELEGCLSALSFLLAYSFGQDVFFCALMWQTVGLGRTMQMFFGCLLAATTFKIS